MPRPNGHSQSTKEVAVSLLQWFAYRLDRLIAAVMQLLPDITTPRIRRVPISDLPAGSMRSSFADNGTGASSRLRAHGRGR
ncbi:MAG: hypothetical protein V1723_00410 [Candidatus Uhrbacteria bacterium]